MNSRMIMTACLGALVGLIVTPRLSRAAADLASDDGKSLIIGQIRIVTRNVREIVFTPTTMTLYLKPPELSGIPLPFTPRTNAAPANNIGVILSQTWLIDAGSSQTAAKFLNPAALDISYCEERQSGPQGTEDIFDGSGHKVASVIATYRARITCQDGAVYNGSTY